MTQAPNPSTPRIDGLLLAVGAFVVYCLLGQHTLYRFDGHVFLLKSHFQELTHAYHVFYCPLLQWLKWALQPFDPSIYESALLYSQLGATIGVWFVHMSARRLGLRRVDAAFVTALVATCPALMFYATVVEAHGPFFAFAGIAIFFTAGAPTLGWSVLTGLGIGTLYLAHPTGSLMLALLPAILVTAHGYDLRGTIRPTLLSALVAVVFIAVVPGFIRQSGGAASAGFTLAYISDYLAKVGPNLWAIVVWEWLWPYAALSALWLVALGTRRWRRPACFLAAGLLPYLAICVLILDKGIHEGGAYLLPVAWPAALLAAEVSRGRPVLRWCALIVAATIGVTRVTIHDQPERARGYYEAILAIADGRPFAVGLGDNRDVEAFFLHFQEAPAAELGKVAGATGAEFERTMTWLDQSFRSLLARGYVVLIRDATIRNLTTAAVSKRWLFAEAPLVALESANADRLWSYLQHTYEFIPVAHGAFSGVRLQLR